MGALAEATALSPEAYDRVRKPFPGQFEERLQGFIARLSPEGNPIQQEEMDRFRELYTAAMKTPPELSADEAFEFFDLTQKVIAEVVEAAKNGRLRDEKDKRVPIEVVREVEKPLNGRAAFVLGYAGSEKKKAPDPVATSS